MKVLSLKQPWADLVIGGEKSIETRVWNTSFRGEFFVHASKSVDKKSCEFFGLNSNKLLTGGIVGRATLDSVKKYENLEDFKKDADKHLALGFYENFSKVYGFHLSKPTRVKFLPLKGKLNFFNF